MNNSLLAVVELQFAGESRVWLAKCAVFKTAVLCIESGGQHSISQLTMEFLGNFSFDSFDFRGFSEPELSHNEGNFPGRLYILMKCIRFCPLIFISNLCIAEVVRVFPEIVFFVRPH